MDPIVIIVACVVGGLTAYLVPLWLIRSGRSPQLAAQREVSMVIKNGALPPNADVWSWRWRLVENRQTVARGRWPMLAAGLLMSLFALGNLADEGAGSLQTWVRVGLAAMALVSAFWMHRQVRRADTLLAAISPGHTGTPNFGAR
ncbi:hypothetical protein L1080_027740 [Rhodococcus sp. MSC1_016]|jgi:hypothetical protein|uniref:hypothetical protein n=1 Tax=Rhodococcus sp. MSC1_016 TaxID=2909266 RepID=UPI002030DD43|nr:hypothetical protein [Rhodococcus sp. MSC1_016]